MTDFSEHLKCTTELSLQSLYLHAPYITHAICLSGEGSFAMHNKTFSVKPNDLFIFIKGNLVTNLQFSADCRLLVLFVAKEYLRLHCANNYGAKLSIDAFQHPVLSLTEAEKDRCVQNIYNIKERLEVAVTPFREETLSHLFQVLALDLFEVHYNRHQSDKYKNKTSPLLSKFLSLLERGDYRTHRAVSYYTENLSVTPPHLSDICTKYSGETAQYWIDAYTMSEILYLIRSQHYSLSQIADQLNFSSLSYFSRYVQRHTGFSPSKFVSLLFIFYFCCFIY